MNIETYISLGLSILATIGTLYTYIVHTSKLNSQQKEINSYYIKHLKEENEQKKKAVLECSAEDDDKESISYLKITNKGKACAYNIRIEVDKDEILPMSNDDELTCPNLRSGETCKLPYFSCCSTFIDQITIIWDDDFEPNRKYTQKLKLGIK